MIKKQTFLTEILLAVSFPTGKIGSTTVTEAIVPVLGCVYGMLMKQRFHELSRLQRVISMALANEQTAQKVPIEISWSVFLLKVVLLSKKFYILFLLNMLLQVYLTD